MARPSTRDDWQRRRGELKSLFEQTEYGQLPPKPEKMTVVRGDANVDAASGVTREAWKLKLEHDGKTLVVDVNLTLPKADGPVPVVVQGAFGRPGQLDRLRAFTDHGYAVAEVNFMQVASDAREHARESGIYQLFGDDLDCGALMAWAWGVQGAIDALEQDNRIDAKKVVITGHSRFGEAALVAGEFDERIALTVPSHSGCAGSAPFRFIYGNSEQLHNIVGAFPTGSGRTSIASSAKWTSCQSTSTSSRPSWRRGPCWPPRGPRMRGPTPRDRN